MMADGGAQNPWADLPSSLGPLKAIFESLQGAMAGADSSSERPIDWTQALQTAEQLTTKPSEELSGPQDLYDADRIARNWVADATDFKVASDATAVIPRAAWPGANLDNLRLIATPIAQRSSTDALDNFRRLMPGQPDEFYQLVAAKLSGVAARLHGIQLGHLLAGLAAGVLIGSELSLRPQQPPLLVLENARDFAESVQGSKMDALIYLASRELLTAALLDSNPWIRESLVTQVVRYSSHLTFNSDGMQEIQQAIENSDFESLGELMGTMVNVEPSPEQTESQAAIQHLIQLITGWADFRVLQACRHLSGLAAIDEAYRRKRATDSPISRTFRLLLNIGFEPVQIRQASMFWQAISAKLPSDAVDGLWRHPDLMPTPDEVKSPDVLLARLSGGVEDDFDAALKKLLDETDY